MLVSTLVILMTGKWLPMVQQKVNRSLSSPLGYPVQCQYIYLVSGETEKIHRKNDHRMEDKT